MSFTPTDDRSQPDFDKESPLVVPGKHAINYLRAGLTAASILYLAFLSQSFLSPLFDSVRLEYGNASIQVQGTRTAQDGHLWVDAIIADGQLLKWDAIDRGTGWNEVDTGLILHSLSAPENTPAVLSFRCKRLVATLRPYNWSGTIVVKRNGSLSRIFDVQPSESELVIDDPQVSRSWLVFFIALSVFAGLAAWFAPVYSNRSITGWLLFAVSCAHVLYWACSPVGTNGDSEGYLQTVAINFHSGMPSYFPPGYPTFMAVLRLIDATTLGSFITFVQHAMSVIVVYWLYKLLVRIVSGNVAFLAGLLAGLLPPVFAISQSVLSEVPTGFAMVGAVYFAVRCKETGKVIPAILSGVCMAFAGLLRMVPFISLVPAICLIFLRPRSKQNFRQLAIIPTTAASIIVCFLAWFGARSGVPKLTTSTGFHLYNRVLAEQKLINDRGAETRRFRQLLAGHDPFVPHWFIAKEPGLRNLSYAEAGNLLHAVAMEGILGNPARYLLYTCSLAWRDYIAETGWVPGWDQSVDPDPSLANRPVLPFGSGVLAWQSASERLQSSIWPVLCWLAILGALLGAFSINRNIVFAIAVIPVGYLLASGAVEYFSPRYNAPLVPLIAAVAVIPLDPGSWRHARALISALKDLR